ncbi:hypothetical protein FUAX_37180 [Fulvitalea axinellae]|uniref:Uncharacterized protein n=1 Tax=Fulvitalea axinellae TaxID=1182444 RepID=A0AAU9CGJ6_9BACT|nr:hypothetical protein FUAX_37180 [Fulvitalea axinellae]
MISEFMLNNFFRKVMSSKPEKLALTGIMTPYLALSLANVDRA